MAVGIIAEILFCLRIIAPIIIVIMWSISFAKAVISTDSGPMHLARAVNTPLVAIFFQTDPSLGFSPIPSDKTLVISESLPCKPCSLHGQNEVCPAGHFKCRQIDIEKTVKQIFDFLSKL